MKNSARIQFFCIIPLLILILCMPAFSDRLTDRVDRVFSDINGTDRPGCALMVIKDGRVLHKKGFGMANLELGVPISPQSVFYIGSVSKQFVAFCVALLVQQGKVDLDANINTYIPELPVFKDIITVRHLIHHTSGLRDYLTLESLTGIDFGTYHEEDVLDLLCRQKELNFKPGEQHMYCNSGYFLLSVLIKRVSGISLREFAEKHIFQPLGMTHSRFHDNFQELIPNRATGYFPSGRKGNRYLNFLSTFDNVGSGGLFTSVEDLKLWDQNFYTQKVGGPEVHTLIHTKGRLNNGQELDYAFALVLGEFRGLKTVSHGGALGGYRSELLRFPDQQFSVICLSNFSSANPSELTHKVAVIYLEELLGSDPPKKKPVPAQKMSRIELPEDKLKEYTGDYTNDELDLTYSLGIRESRLMFVHEGAPRFRLISNKLDRFQAGGFSLRFQRDTDGRIIGFRLDAGRAQNIRFIKTK